MINTYYKIMAKKSNGDIFECFTFVGLPEDGIRRAYYDSVRFGVEIIDSWAVKLDKYAG